MDKFYYFFKSPIKLVVFIVFLGFIGHQFLQMVLKIHVPILDNYYDMFALGVCLPWLYLWERRLLFKGRQLKNLSPLQLILMTVWVGIITEVLFPIMSSSFVADIWDVIVFGVGALFFYYFQKSRSF